MFTVGVNNLKLACVLYLLMTNKNINEVINLNRTTLHVAAFQLLKNIANKYNLIIIPIIGKTKSTKR